MVMFGRRLLRMFIAKAWRNVWLNLWSFLLVSSLWALLNLKKRIVNTRWYYTSSIQENVFHSPCRCKKPNNSSGTRSNLLVNRSVRTIDIHVLCSTVDCGRRMSNRNWTSVKFLCIKFWIGYFASLVGTLQVQLLKQFKYLHY